MNNTMNILETITEEINLKFDDLAIVKVKGEYIHLISQNRRAKDCWEMEQQMEEIFEYVIASFVLRPKNRHFKYNFIMLSIFFSFKLNCCSYSFSRISVL